MLNALNGPKTPKGTAIFWGLFCALLSLTRFIIALLKRSSTKEQSGEQLRAWNKCWFAWETFLAITLLLVSLTIPVSEWYCSVLFALCICAFWRINEIVYAFSADSLSRIRNEEATSNLRPYERIQMLMRSYLGLVVQFAILYFCLTPGQGFAQPLGDFRDSLYFSAITQTAIGQEGQEVKSHWLRLVHVYQSGAGILLLVLAVSIYIDHASRNDL